MLSIIIAVFAYSLIDVGKTIQKVGVDTWKKSRAKGGGIWLLGILCGTIASFLILYALSIGSVILVGSLAGTGMVAMIIIARITLNEKVGPLQLIAIGVIIAGPFLMAGASRFSVDIEYNSRAMWIFITALITPCVLAAFILRKHESLGIVLAIGGGVLAGLVSVFQKLAGSSIGQEAAVHIRLSEDAPQFLHTVLKVLFNPYSVTWIFLSIVSTIAMLLAHRVEQAVRSIPIFNSGVILVPVLAGIVVFSERLKPLQWLGVAAIFIGMGILIFRPPEAAKDMI